MLMTVYTNLIVTAFPPSTKALEKKYVDSHVVFEYKYKSNNRLSQVGLDQFHTPTIKNVYKHKIELLVVSLCFVVRFFVFVCSLYHHFRSLIRSPGSSQHRF